MGEVKQKKNVLVDKLIPYVNNAKVHSEDQVLKIASSIREFGFVAPIIIDPEYNVIAGHGRLMAAKKLGMDKVPCVIVEGLTKLQDGMDLQVTTVTPDQMGFVLEASPSVSDRK